MLTLTISGEVGSEGAKAGGGVTAGHSVTYSYESTLSHTSETTWTAQDYEIIPKPYTDGARDEGDEGDEGDRSARRYARWVLDVATPTFAASNPNMALGDWQVSTAARSSVTSNTEAIFWVGLNEADTVKLYGATDWEDGISVFEPGVGHGHTFVYHFGNRVELNFTRPIHTALINATNEGSRDKVFIPFTQSGGRYINDK